MNNLERNNDEKFFYAIDDVEYYDETIELTVPYYSLIHQTMIDILSYHFKDEKRSRANGIVLDVGAGTGKESISVLKNFPELNVLAIDLCPPMKNVFEKNYVTEFGINSNKRYEYLIDDITTISDENKEITGYYKAKNKKGCCAAISAYCIHHFPLHGKKEIYQKMFNFLEPGGILINMDLFNYESDNVKKQAHEFDIAYIKREFDNPDAQFEKSELIPLKKRMELKEKWVCHMNCDNILNSVESQINLLKDIGFIEAECIFKYWQQGVIRAVKPL